MQVINYKRGYSHAFDCVIHGRIRVFGKAELAIIEHLLSTMPVDSSYPWIKPNAIKKFNERIHDKTFHLGTTPTDYIAHYLNLRGYKQGNYIFTIE